MLCLLSPAEICNEILAAKTYQESSLRTFPPEYQQLIESQGFFVYQSVELKQISKELQSETTYLNVLTNHNFSVRFNGSYIQKIGEILADLNEQQVLTVAYTIFMEYLAWNIEYQVDKITDGLNYLVKTLLHIRDKATSMLQVIMSCLYQCFYIYYSHTPFTNQRELNQCLPYFFALDQTYPPQAFDLLSIALKYMIDPAASSVDNETIAILNFITVASESMKSQFPKNLAESVLTTIMFLLANLYIPALDVFSHLTQFLSPDDTLKAFSTFANGLFRNIRNSPPTSIIPQGTTFCDKPDFPPLSATEVSLRFSDKTTFEKGVNLKQEISYPEYIEPIEFGQKEVLKQVVYVAAVADDNQQLINYLLESVVTILKKTDNDTYMFDQYIAFLQLCSEVNGQIRKSDFEILISPPLFDPRITIFDKFSDFQKINSLRSKVIRLLFKYPEFISTILLRWVQQPYLFAEIVNRLSRYTTSIFLPNEKLVTSASKALMQTSLYYQQLHATATDKKPIELARISILILISQILHPADMNTFYFSNQFFVNFFLSFLFELPLRSYILSHLLTFLSNRNAKEVPKQLLSILQHILEITFPLFPDAKCVILISDILQTLNEAFVHQYSFANQFEVFCTSIFQYLLELNQTDCSQKYLLQCIQFFAQTMNEKTINAAQICALEQAIINVFGDEIPIALTNKLIQLLAGECVASLSPTFNIRQPKILKLFVNTSLKSSRCVDVLGFIDDLIQYSSLNAICCHQSGFDLHLVWIIKEQTDQKIIEILLQLFQHIASVISSVTVVQKFISLLSPIDGRFVPENEEMVLQTINKIITNSSKRPMATIPLVETAGNVEISGLNACDLEKGFTVAFWIYLDSSHGQYNPQIVNISDAKNSSFKLFVSSYNMFCIQRTQQFESNGRIQYKIPRHHWEFVTVTSTQNQETNLLPVFGCSEAKPLDFVPLQFHSGPLTCQFGGVTSSSTSSELISLLGPFGIFPVLSMDEITSLYEIGPRVIGKLPVQPICFYNTSEIDGKLTITPISTPETIEAHLSNEKLRFTMSFTEILINFCKLEMMLPLLAQLDMTTVDGVAIPNHIKSSIELFGNTLTISKQAQESFLRGNGPQIMAHLLFSAPDKLIDYNLYLQIFTIAHSLTNGDLQINFMKNILINPEIWLKSDADNHLRILKHWARVLFPSMKKSLILSFRDILFMMRVYYWYNIMNEEKEYIKYENRTRGDLLNISECRQNLAHIAMIVANVQFNDQDYICLISHCITNTDVPQVVDLLQLLINLANSNPSPISTISPETDLYSFIYVMLPRRNEEITCFLLEVIIILYRNHFVEQPTLADHISYLQEQFTPSTRTLSLLERLIKVIQKGFYEIFPICFHIAQSYTDEMILWMISELKPSPDYNYHVSWSLSAIILCYTTDNDLIQSDIINFLAKCGSSCWQELYEMIHVVGFVLEKQTNNFKTLLLQSIATYLENLEPNQLSDADVFYNLAKFFLLFRTDKEVSHRMDKYYHESPFFNDLPDRFEDNMYDEFEIQEEPIESYLTPVRQSSYMTGSLTFGARMVRKGVVFPRASLPSVNIPVIPQNPSFIDLIKTLEIPNFIYRFGLRFDDDGNWIDYDLAIRVLNIYHLHTSPNYLHLVLMLSSFVLHIDQEFALNVIKSFKYSESTVSVNSNFFHLFNHHCQMVGVAPHIIIAPVSTIDEKAFQCLQKQHFFVEGNLPSYMKQLFYTIQDFVSQSSRNLIKSVNLIDETVISESQSQLSTGIKTTQILLQQHAKIWSRLWRCLAVDPAPWSANLNEAAKFKRDGTFCNTLCPIKMKRNWKFDPHKQASQLRDSNGDVTAQQLVETELQERLSDNDMPSALLDLNDNDIHEEKSNNDSSHKKRNSRYNLNSLLNIECFVINPAHKKKAFFILKHNRIELQYKDGKNKVIPLNDVSNIFFRRTSHRPNSLEIFTTTGRTYFIRFIHHNSLSVIHRISALSTPNIRMLQTSSFSSFFKQHSVMPLWVRNQISNFEYLMHLNLMSGRTFNDLSQYPVFPWVLIDFTSETLDLNNPNIYRPLFTPVGALNPQRLEHIMKNYQAMLDCGEVPFMYGSGYSYSMNICTFLLRMEPFTSIHIKFHNGQFGNPNTLFTSIEETFKAVTNKTNDYRELTPEFYCSPEFLINSNRFDLGETSRGKIYNVVLPKWAKSPAEFVYLMRKALESDIVSLSLHLWIDLIWGVKQNGRDAINSYNLFRNDMYDSVWKEEQDPHKIAQIEATLNHLGQIPPQLFTTLHPSKHINEKPAMPFAQPFLIPASSITRVSLSCVDRIHKGKYRIVMVDPNGLMTVNMADFSHLKPQSVVPKYGKMSPYNPDGLTMSISTSDTTIKGIEIEEVKNISLTAVYKEIKNFAEHKFDAFERSGSVARTLNRNLIAISNKNNNLYMIDLQKQSVEFILKKSVCVATCDDYLAVASDDAVLYVYKGDNHSPLFMMPSYGEMITCCCINSSFFIVVVGTKDGTLIVNSLNKGSIVRVINLKGARPLLVTVTTGWGFIVTYAEKMKNGAMKRYMYVFNVNGELLKKKKMDFRVVEWTHWTSNKGFDYMIIADENGKLFALEVFYCDLGEGLFRCRAPVTSLQYITDISTVVAVTKDGRILFIPHNVV